MKMNVSHKVSSFNLKLRFEHLHPHDCIHCNSQFIILRPKLKLNKRNHPSCDIPASSHRCLRLNSRLLSSLTAIHLPLYLPISRLGKQPLQINSLDKTKRNRTPIPNRQHANPITHHQRQKARHSPRYILPQYTVS